MRYSQGLSLQATFYLAFTLVATTVTGVAWYGYQNAEHSIHAINEESESTHHLMEDIGEIKYLTIDSHRLALQSIHDDDRKLLMQAAIQANRIYETIAEMRTHLEEDDADIDK